MTNIQKIIIIIIIIISISIIIIIQQQSVLQQWVYIRASIVLSVSKNKVANV